jgi:hypothetical protein
MMRVLNSSQSHAIIYLTHVSVYKQIDRMFEYILCTVYRQNFQIGCAECFRRLAAFKRVINVRYKVLQITLLIRDYSRMLFFAIFTTVNTLNIYPLRPNQIMCIPYMNATHESLRLCN